MSLWQKLMNKIFGWHYVAIQYGFDIDVYKVVKAPSGKLYAKCYGTLVPLSSHKYEPMTWKEEEG